MRILTISGSPRENGNSDRLLWYFSTGAKDKGHEVVSYRVEDMNIHGCRGCGACFEAGKCIHADDMQIIYGEMYKADHIAIAFPIYMAQMPGQLKQVIDRFLALCNNDFSSRLEKHPEITFFVTSGSDELNMNKVYLDFTSGALAFLGLQTKDSLITSQNREPDAVDAKKDVIDRAYLMGNNL